MRNLAVLVERPELAFGVGDPDRLPMFAISNHCEHALASSGILQQSVVAENNAFSDPRGSFPASSTM